MLFFSTFISPYHDLFHRSLTIWCRHWHLVCHFQFFRSFACCFARSVIRNLSVGFLCKSFSLWWSLLIVCDDRIVWHGISSIADRKLIKSFIFYCVNKKLCSFISNEPFFCHHLSSIRMATWARKDHFQFFHFYLLHSFFFVVEKTIENCIHKTTIRSMVYERVFKQEKPSQHHHHRKHFFHFHFWFFSFFGFVPFDENDTLANGFVDSLADTAWSQFDMFIFVLYSSVRFTHFASNRQRQWRSVEIMFIQINSHFFFFFVADSWNQISAQSFRAFRKKTAKEWRESELSPQCRQLPLNFDTFLALFVCKSNHSRYFISIVCSFEVFSLRFNDIFSFHSVCHSIQCACDKSVRQQRGTTTMTTWRKQEKYPNLVYSVEYHKKKRQSENETKSMTE